MPTLQTYQCNLCDRKFKREDHLSRHKLSHGRAKFQCQHPKCGMTFHRKDVLQRHSRVHEPDPAVKRRRPRRGVEPKPFVRNGSPSLKENGGPQWLPIATPDFSPITSTDNHSPTVDEDPLAGLPSEVLRFCCLHFQHTCMRRFAFIHSTSIDLCSIIPEKLLAMAALGGSVIPEYKIASKGFFERAQQLFSKRWGQKSLAPITRCSDSSNISLSDEDLSLFQAQILLIEFALWSSTAEDRQWASGLAIQLGTGVVSRMIQYVKSLDWRQDEWLPWVHREQWIRSLWAFYCTGQKAKLLLASSFSTLDLLRNMQLPAPDSIFEAEDEMNWQRRITVTMIASRPVPTFGDAFFALMSPSVSSECILEHVTTLGRHVLLAALLDLYHSALLLPSNFDCSKSYQTRDLTHFKPHPSFAQALVTWRRLWWASRSEMFRSGPARSADLQNVLLLNYLEVQLFEHEDPATAVKTRNKTVISTMCDIFCDITADGILEVSSVFTLSLLIAWRPLFVADCTCLPTIGCNSDSMARRWCLTLLWHSVCQRHTSLDPTYTKGTARSDSCQ